VTPGSNWRCGRRADAPAQSSILCERETRPGTGGISVQGEPWGAKSIRSAVVGSAELRPVAALTSGRICSRIASSLGDEPWRRCSRSGRRGRRRA
jgi:hypothetical protein